jgi:uncharacterized repeat protein (TIGR01451 family)
MLEGWTWNADGKILPKAYTLDIQSMFFEALLQLLVSLYIFLTPVNTFMTTHYQIRSLFQEVNINRNRIQNTFGLVAYAIFTFLFVSSPVYSQTPCGPTPIPGLTCTDACLVSDLKSISGTLPIPTGQTTQFSCGAIMHNPHWYAFRTPTFQSERVMTIVGQSANCQDGDGIQLLLFKSCADTMAIACGSSSGGSYVYLNFEPEPNTVYFLAIDGYNGDICDYSISNFSLSTAGISFTGLAGVCNGAPIPSDEPVSVCLNCSLSQYSGTTTSFTPTSLGSSGFCGSLESEQWLAFMPRDTQFTITASAQNCLDGNGIQIAVYQAEHLAAPIACSGSEIGMAGLVHQLVVKAEAGKPHFLLIDGWAGDQCDFNLNISPSSALMASQVPISGTPTLMGEDSICGVWYDHYRINGMSGSTKMTFEGTPGAFINNQPLPITLLGDPGRGFHLTMPINAPFVDLKVKFHNDCSNQTTVAYPLKRIYSKATPVFTYPDTVVCGPLYTAPWGDIIEASGVFTGRKPNPGGCDSIFSQRVSLFPQPVIGQTIDTMLCNNSSGISICGEWLQGAGNYLVSCSALQCDTVTSVHLSYFEDFAEIQGQTFYPCGGGPISLSTTLVWQPSMGTITHEWLGPNGAVVGNDPNLFVSLQGIYTHKISGVVNGILCTASDTIHVPYQPINQNYSITPTTNCSTGLIDITLNWQGVNLSNVTWTGPGFSGTGSQVSVPFPGYFQVQIDGLTPSCDIEWTIYINPQGPTNQVYGRVYLDTDKNCVLDANDMPLSGVQVSLYPQFSPYSQYDLLTSADGSFSETLQTGNYLVETPYPYSNCPLLYVPTGCNQGTDTLIVLVQEQQFCTSIVSSIATPLMRPCIDGIYYVTSTNHGDVLSDIDLEVQLDPRIEYLGSTNTPTQVQGQKYTFRLPSIQPQEMRQFEISYKLDCAAPLGQVHCTTMATTPIDTCLGYAGPELSVNAICQGDSVIVNVKNTSAQPTVAPHAYFWFTADAASQTIANHTGTLSLAAYETRRFAYLAGVDTFVFVVEQSPLYPFGKQTGVVVTGCNIPTANTMILPTGINQNPIVYCLPNVNSFDPNDKNGFPAGIGDGNYIDQGSDIEYTIRFQNTGTAPAFVVEVRDTLPPYLDVQTLVVTGTSHPNNLMMERGSGNTVKFLYQAINLPDSTSNEPRSHGFISFKVKQTSNNSKGVQIKNRAAIYFDQNAPVLTNTTLHTNGIPMSGLSKQDEPRIQQSLVLQPNPTTDICTVNQPKGVPDQLYRLLVHDIYGREVARYPQVRLPLDVQMGAYSPGVYLIKVQSADGLLEFTGSVVKL